MAITGLLTNTSIVIVTMSITGRQPLVNTINVLCHGVL
jgi:hypothetical protein